MKRRTKPYKKLRIRYNVGRWIMGRFHGKVLYPFVLFSQPKDQITASLFRHELEHVYQVQRMGWFKFYATYLIHAVKYGYDKIPVEVEASKIQYTPLTEAERKLFDES